MKSSKTAKFIVLEIFPLYSISQSNYYKYNIMTSEKDHPTVPLGCSIYGFINTATSAHKFKKSFKNTSVQ